MKKKRLGEALHERGKISAEDLQKLITEQQGKLMHMGELMLERGLVKKSDLATALQEISGIPYFDCASASPSPEILKLIPKAMAQRLLALPLKIDRRRLVVAMAAPQDLRALDELRFTSGYDIAPMQSFRNEIRKALDRAYRAPGERSSEYGARILNEPIELEEIEFFSTSSRQANQEAIQEMHADLRQRKTPAVQLVSEVIQIAVAKQASDIHIEPHAKETFIRVRVDGVLRDLQTVPRALQTSLISRIKILSDMDIAERRAPQDGRFMVSIGSRPHDMRVSTLPTQYGEKVVIRLLETNAPLTSFDNLGIAEEVAAGLEHLISQPQGMILVTGPTGSGKTTTLYSCLNRLRKPSVNIVTVEDPVEYVLPGVNQAHVNTKAGMTFASCLRSILRQDPNIIMVGEVRDLETAEIAIKAAQTGHLVLSTLHTNDSVSAIVRLLDLGIPNYMISSSVTGILAQRLVRKLCSCNTTQAATPEFRARLARMGVTAAPERMSVAIGCDACDQTGYRGRVGIYELMWMEDTIRGLIRSEGNGEQIREAARANGMRSMLEDAVQKLRDGLTTVDEILRVVPVEHSMRTECQNCRQRFAPLFKFCPSCGTVNATYGQNARSSARPRIREEIVTS